MKYREILKLLTDDGWYQVNQKGSHKQFHHSVKKGTLTVAYHQLNDDIPIGTLKSIKKQAGL